MYYEEDDYYSDNYAEEHEDSGFNRQYYPSDTDDDDNDDGVYDREYFCPSPPRRPSSPVLSLPTGPKFVVLRGSGNPETEHERVEAPTPVPAPVVPAKPVFSWGKPVSVVAPLDMGQIMAEEEIRVRSQREEEELRQRREAEREKRRRDDPRQRLHQQDNYRRSHHHGGRSEPPQRGPHANDRLLKNPRADRLPRSDKPRDGPPPVRDTSRDNPHRERERNGNGNDPRNDLLCIHPKGHNPSCNLTHTMEKWAPKTCKYTKGCTRGNQCSYWHQGAETKREYLIRALREDIVFFRKNKTQYMKTYRIPSV